MIFFDLTIFIKIEKILIKQRAIIKKYKTI